MTAPVPPAVLRPRQVFTTWWPLAASWLLMGLELPAVAATMARLPEPRVSLAAYGGVVFPLALLIESPIVMLLAASTAVARDWTSYRVVRRFMLTTSLALTALHALIAFTPLYDLVVAGLLGVPDEIRDPARVGLQIMLPWTFSIAYRRTQQGVLIRNGHSRAVGIGTGIRLAATALVLVVGMIAGHLPGIVIGTLAVAAGVASEAVYAAVRVHSVLHNQVRPAPSVDPPLTMARFVKFYLPLSVTPLIVFLAMPMSSAAMSRMARPLDSLAAWPVVSGLIFTLRSSGFALNEVVVALLDRPGAATALRRFAQMLAAVTTGLLLLVAITPLSGLWFGRISALAPDLEALARSGLWVGITLPALTVLQNLYQGVVVHSHRTRGVTEAVLIYLLTSAAVLGAGVRWVSFPGLYVALASMVVGSVLMVAWLRLRAAPELRALDAGDRAQPVAAPEYSGSEVT